MKRGFDEASCLKSSSGDKRFRLVVSRNWSGPGKSSSGDWKIAESDFGWTKSSQKSLSRWKGFYAPLVRWYHKIFFKKHAGLLVFYSGSNECSLAPQFKWLDNTFEGAQAWDIRDRVIYTERSHLGRWLEDWSKKSICFLAMTEWSLKIIARILSSWLLKNCFLFLLEWSLQIMARTLSSR